MTPATPTADPTASLRKISRTGSFRSHLVVHYQVVSLEGFISLAELGYPFGIRRHWLNFFYLGIAFKQKLPEAGTLGLDLLAQLGRFFRQDGSGDARQALQEAADYARDGATHQSQSSPLTTNRSENRSASGQSIIA